MTANATHAGRITIPGTDIGVRGTLIAEPQAEDMLLTLDDRLALGPVKVDTDASGNLEDPGLVVPIIASLVWLLRFEPFDHNRAAPFTLGYYNLNTSGVPLDDLVAMTIIAVDSTVVPGDAAVGAYLANPASASRIATDSLYGLKPRSGTRSVGQGEIFFNVDDYTGSDSAKLAAACAAATTAKGNVLLPAGRMLDVGNGFSMSGYSCGIRGHQASWTNATPGAPNGSGLKATTQTGPVLDFTGFNWPRGYRSAVQFSDFTVEGSGVADATKANKGIFLPFAVASGSVTWRNLVIANTGGQCFQGSGLYFQRFENIRLVRPINARSNNVPHFEAGNMTQCDLDLIVYSPDAAGASDDCATLGAVYVYAAGGFASTMNKINLMCENIHMPSNGAILSFAGNNSELEIRNSDCKQETGATAASFIQLNNSASQDFGGNLVKGNIWGDNNNAPQHCDVGVDVFQSNNRIAGTKCFKGRNVRLNAGVQRTYVSLMGAFSTADGVGTIDNSGQTNNTILDFFNFPGTGRAGATGMVGELTSTASVTNTVTQTALWTAPTVSAASLQAGITKLSLSMAGLFDNQATSGTFQIKLVVNGGTLGTFSVGASQTGAATGRSWVFDADIYVIATGSGGSVKMAARGVQVAAAGTSQVPIATVADTTARDLSTGLTVRVDGQMGTASATNTLYLTSASLNREA